MRRLHAAFLLNPSAGLLAVLALVLTGCSSGSPSTPTPVTVASMSISGNAGSAVVGQTVTLVATATFSNNTTSNVTSQAAWESSNTAVATVPSAGVVTTVSAGSVDIRATFQGVVATTRINVTPPAPTITSLAVTGVDSRVTVGDTGILKAVATYSDGTTADVTMQVTWSSSNTAIATVSPAGSVSFVSAGDVDLRAAIGSITGFLRVRVEPAVVFGALTGVVRNEITNQPVAGVLVRVVGGPDDGRSDRTNDSGTYVIRDLSAGTFRVEFSSAGPYSSTSRVVSLSGDTRLDVALTPNVSQYFGTYNITLVVLRQTCVPPVAFGTQNGTLELAGQSNGTGLTVKITERGVSRTYTGGLMDVDGTFNGSLPAGTLFPGGIRPRHEISSTMRGTVTGSAIAGVENMLYTQGCQPGAIMDLSFSGSR